MHRLSGKHFLLSLAVGAHAVKQNKEKVITVVLQSQLTDTKNKLHLEDYSNQTLEQREDPSRTIGRNLTHSLFCKRVKKLHHKSLMFSSPPLVGGQKKGKEQGKNLEGRKEGRKVPFTCNKKPLSSSHSLIEVCSLFGYFFSHAPALFPLLPVSPLETQHKYSTYLWQT